MEHYTVLLYVSVLLALEHLGERPLSKIKLNLVVFRLLEPSYSKYYSIWYDRDLVVDSIGARFVSYGILS
jgi:hypothetical protein